MQKNCKEMRTFLCRVIKMLLLTLSNSQTELIIIFSNE